MTIRGTTQVIAHIGFPPDGFKSPPIYNAWFEEAGVDAVVVPMGCRADDYPGVLRAIFALTNVGGALITMPHKRTTAALVDEASKAVAIAGSCNAVRRLDAVHLHGGRLHGDLFDGAGFVGALRRKGCDVAGARAFIAGAGGVGSAIASSLADAGVRSLALDDIEPSSATTLATRLATAYPDVEVATGVDDPAGCDLVVNATPMGMRASDPMPIDVDRIDRHAWVSEVVMSPEMTPFLCAAQERGCRLQVGTDMLFEQIPIYLEYFGFPTTTPEHLRELARGL